MNPGFLWEQLPQGSILVDVGGGIGGHSIKVADAYPHICVVVEDREQVVSTAKEVSSRELGNITQDLTCALATGMGEKLCSPL